MIDFGDTKNLEKCVLHLFLYLNNIAECVYPSQTDQKAHHSLDKFSENAGFCDFYGHVSRSHLAQLASQNEKRFQGAAHPLARR